MQKNKQILFLLILFCLIKNAFAELSFTVTAEATTETEKQSQKITEITSEEIQSFHASNCAEVLRKAANANVKQYGAYGSAFSVYLRSFNGGTVAILVDGIQVNSAQTGEFDLTRINVNDIEKIEIIEGASDSKYTVSGSVGGIINIITKQKPVDNSSDKVMFTADLSNLFYSGLRNGGNIFDTQNFFTSLSQTNDIASWKISGSFVNAKNNYEFEDFIGRKKIRTNDDAKTYSAYASSLFKIKQSTLQITENFFNGNVHTPGTETSIVTGHQKDLYNCINLLYKKPEILYSLADFSSQLSYKYDRTFFDENSNDNNATDISLHKLHTLASNIRSSFFLNNYFTLTTAADISLNYLDSTNCESTDTIVYKNIYGFSLAGDYTNDFLSLYPSVKLIYSGKEFAPVPKLGIKFNKIDLAFNVYRMFTSPTLNQLYWKNTYYAIGNPNLKNESGWGCDANITIDKINNMKIDLGIFAMYYKDKIKWVNITQQKMTCANIAKAMYLGGNIFLNYTPVKWLALNAKYDLNLSYLLTGDFTLKDKKRIMYTPVNIFSFDTDFSFKNLSINLSYTFTGKRYLDDNNSVFLKAYSLLDLSFEYKFYKEMLLYINLKNLLNERYYEIDGYPMPGFSCKAGVKLSV